MAAHLVADHRGVSLYAAWGAKTLRLVRRDGGKWGVGRIPRVTLWVAGVLEFYGGLGILLGVFTRPVALVLSGQMAVAYFMGHASRGFWPLLNRGELAVLYCFVFLLLAAAGGGPYALEHLWKKPAG